MTQTPRARESLLELPLRELLERISAADRLPGSGVVAAAATALAAALTGMAARASADCWPEAGGAVAQAEALRRRASALVDAEHDAYAAAVEALDHARGGAPGDRPPPPPLGPALEHAAQVPERIAHAALDVAVLAAEAAECATGDVRADAAAAAELAAGAAAGAFQLVAVNLLVSAGDPRVDAVGAVAEAAAAAAARAGRSVTGLEVRAP